MRCLALAEVMRLFGYRIVFASRQDGTDVIPALKAAKVELVALKGAVASEADELADAVSGKCDVLVVDHYERGEAFERACRPWSRTIVVFDDGTGRRHDCDVLVDSGATDGQSYRGLLPAEVVLLTGPQFALLRRAVVERRAAAVARRSSGPVSNVFVSLGATDPSNATAAVLDAIKGYSVPVTVALSAMAPHIDAISRKSSGTVRLVLDADTPQLMENADLAIGAAGSSAFERACLGLPSIFVKVASNQNEIAHLLKEKGVAEDAGPIDIGFAGRIQKLVSDLSSDGERRVRMACAASALVDGRGTGRVLAVIAGALPSRDGQPVRLRLAEAGDERWLLDLQKQPMTRRYARNPGVPSAGEHAAWFARALEDASRLLMIIQCANDNAGMVRLDRIGSATFEVSIAVDQGMHGRGIGRAGLALIRKLAPGVDLVATVLPENRASIALFVGAGYRAESGERYRNCAA